jgi:pimeloyl-ACP methyl ester carboxylesterase
MWSRREVLVMLSATVGGLVNAKLAAAAMAQDRQTGEGSWLAKHETPDGRVIEYFDSGPVAGGLPLVCHHGTPASALLYLPWKDAAAAAGMRVIAYSRPGYGVSDRLAGRDVAQAARDTASLLDHLGAEKFVTTGWSGGGPHALACGALLPGRCRGVATLAGVGAWGQDDLDFLAGMGQENIDEFSAAVSGEKALSDFLAEHYPTFNQVTGPEVAESLGGLISPPDKAALTDALADNLAAAFRWSLHSGFGGWIDDDLAFTKPWGFQLSDVRVPVTVWQGQQDNMVPGAHGKWLAERIPGAQFVFDPNQGHISLGTTHLDAILRGLADLGR